MSKYIEESFMTFVMLFIITAMVLISFRYPVEARFMVLVVGLPGIGLCLLQLGIDYRKYGRADKPETPAADARAVAGEAAPENTFRNEMVLWGYFIGLIAGVLLFGFYVAVPVYLFVFLLFIARLKATTALIYTVAASIFLYLLFTHVFKLPLHTSFITEYVLDLLGEF